MLDGVVQLAIKDMYKGYVEGYRRISDDMITNRVKRIPRAEFSRYHLAYITGFEVGKPVSFLVAGLLKYVGTLGIYPTVKYFKNRGQSYVDVDDFVHTLIHDQLSKHSDPLNAGMLAEITRMVLDREGFPKGEISLDDLGKVIFSNGKEEQERGTFIPEYTGLMEFTRRVVGEEIVKREWTGEEE